MYPPARNFVYMHDNWLFKNWCRKLARRHRLHWHQSAAWRKHVRAREMNVCAFLKQRATVHGKVFVSCIGLTGWAIWCRQSTGVLNHQNISTENTSCFLLASRDLCAYDCHWRAAADEHLGRVVWPNLCADQQVYGRFLHMPWNITVLTPEPLLTTRIIMFTKKRQDVFLLSRLCSFLAFSTSSEIIESIGTVKAFSLQK